MRIEHEIKLDYDDVLITPKRSNLGSRKEVDLSRRYKFLHSESEFFGMPIIGANMDHTGTVKMSSALAQHGMMTALHKFVTEKDLRSIPNPHVRSRMFYSCGINHSLMEADNPIDAYGFQYICLDVANGYSNSFVDFIREVRDAHPDAVIMAGNVATKEMVQEYLFAGADIVKIGIGPGSVCTTRKVTGVGYPQLSAVIECADTAHGLGGHVCADGGCKTPGDVVKAFAAGADFVMLGGMLAGHDECSGKVIKHSLDPTRTQPYMKFHGMASREAMEEHYGGVASHRAPEGKEVEVPYRGPVENTVQEILGGLRSACTYVGASDLKGLSKCTTFIRVSNTHNKIFGA